MPRLTRAEDARSFADALAMAPGTRVPLGEDDEMRGRLVAVDMEAPPGYPLDYRLPDGCLVGEVVGFEGDQHDGHSSILLVRLYDRRSTVIRAGRGYVGRLSPEELERLG